MVTLIILALVILVFGFILKIQLYFHKLKEQHFTTIFALQKKMSNALEVQGTLNQHISILNHFGENYKKSNEKIAHQIVALQYEILQSLSDNQ